MTLFVSLSLVDVLVQQLLVSKLSVLLLGVVRVQWQHTYAALVSQLHSQRCHHD